MMLKKANKEAIKYACLHFHYAKAIPVNVLGYNVYNDIGEWCGVIVYGTGANNHIGCEYDLGQGEVIELVRVALNGKQESTSKALAISIKMIKKDVPLCKLIVSYADCDQKHLGTIYQATNWVYVGTRDKNKHNSAYIIKGKKVHGKTIETLIKSKCGLKGLSREEFIKKYIDANATKFITEGKRKYLMPLNKKIKAEIIKLAKPYPKNDGWQKMERSYYKNSR